MDRRCWLMASIVGLLIGCANKDDKSLLQGTWTVVSIETGGNAMPDEEVKKWAFAFTGNQVVVKMGMPMVEESGKIAFVQAGEYKGTFELKADKTPKEFDMVVVRTEDGKEDKGIGIYSLEGNKLKLCFFMDNNKSRPAKFESPKGSQVRLFTLERAKP
jgi:uncharacterized protein (TIGR03067 family)